MIKAIIFDVDGVLLDSFEANFDFFSKLMIEAGFSVPTKEEYRPLFHKTLRDTLKELTGITDEERIQKIFDVVNMNKVASTPPIFHKGVPEVVKQLSREYLLGIVTSRIKAYAFEPPLNSLEFYFKAMIAFEDTENHKPHPEPLLAAAKQLKIDPSDCVYIGDVKNDMDAARAAGMKSILFSSENIGGANIQVSDFEKIPSLIRSL